MGIIYLRGNFYTQKSFLGYGTEQQKQLIVFTKYLDDTCEEAYA